MKINYLLLIFYFITIFTFSQQSKKWLSNNRFLVEKDDKFGVVDSLNKILFPFENQMVDCRNERFVVKKGDKFGLYTYDKKEILPPKNFLISSREFNRFFVALTYLKRGLIDVDGHWIIQPNYRFLSAILDDKFYIVQNEFSLNGLFDFNGKQVFSEHYKFYTIAHDKIFASKNNQAFILDVQNPNQSIQLANDITLVYTNRHYTVNNQYVQLVKKDNKLGLMNAKNEMIIPFIYDQIRSSNNWNYFVVKNEIKYGLIKIDGTIVKETIYDFIEWHNDFIILKRKGFEDDVYYYEEKPNFIYE